ncbi:CYTH and CHAD domain-containing protein [Quadrisphaera sp. DSM 44207]|uniref:CYTH and CHAD domain-containing protein n=1 Tax=Quadrisphaera sp. DSM 44207 TaxID=1881057 RepID=UPI0015A29B07|nr:CYTH and CHAD domain-containing protein [Quadrisphaera sp. DSM 44207]
MATAARPQRHAEVEVALDVPEDWTLPDLAGALTGAGEVGVTGVGEVVEHVLDARYLDTPDLRLLRARTTLRRRTGGQDAGWHLKLPRPDGHRVEVRAPLGSRSPSGPRELTGLVRAIVRTERLTTAARLRTARSVRPVLGPPGEDGRPLVLAEVADDRVQAQVPGPDGAVSTRTWREVEVELVAGDEQLLSAVVAALEAAGARRARVQSKLRRALEDRLSELPEPPGQRTAPPPEPLKPLKPRSPAGQVWLAHLRAQADALVALDPAVRQDEPDSVHRMRVAARRLRSALATGRPLLDREVTDPLRAEVAWLGERLGRLRDAEVAREHLLELLGAQPPELVLGPVRARLEAELDRAVASGRRTARAALDDRRYLRLLDALADLRERPPLTPQAERPAREVLPRRVAGDHRRVAAAARAAAAAQPEEREELLHAVRTAAKRARYAAEALVPVAGEDAARYAAAMARLQGALGTHHDTAGTRRLLRRVAQAASAAGEASFTHGRLHALEEERARAAEEEARRAWEAADRKGLRRWTR